MIYNGNTTIGSFIEDRDQGFTQTLSKLSETFASEHNLDYAKNIGDIIQYQGLLENYKDVLMGDYMSANVQGDMGMHRRNAQKLDALFENAREKILSESYSANLNPIVGLTFPLLKRYWVNCVYKDFVPTEVATQPVVKIAIERLYLQDAKGKKYYLPEAFDEQIDDILGAVRQKLIKTKLPVPSYQYNLIEASGGSPLQQDTLSRDFYISSLAVDVEGTEVVVKTRIPVEPGTGTFSYSVKAATTPVVDDKGTVTTPAKEVQDLVQGSVDFETGIISIVSVQGLVKGYTVDGSLSSENHLRTASTGWDKQEKQFVIPDGDHLATGLTEERIKDEKIIYNIDTTAKAIQTMTDTVTQIKDIKIKRYLDDSKARLKGTQHYKRAIFDCKPPTGYTKTPTEWRQIELKETLDRLAISLRYILKNQNVYFAIMGNPMDVKLLDQVNWIYGQDAEVGGIKLDYNIGLYNNQNRFFIVSSERATPGELQVLLIPTTAEHITYKHFEYQFVISNQYRAAENVRIPSVMLFERSLTDEVIPIQGEVKLINNDVLGTSEIYQKYEV